MSSVVTNNKSGVPTNVELATQVFAQYGHFIRSMIRFQVEDEAEAEDLFQDFFLYLIAKPVPPHIKNVRGFLCKVVSDRVRDALRGINRYRAQIQAYAKPNSPVSEDLPEDVLVEVEEARKMFELIERRLPTNEALAVTLRYRENHGLTEIAQKIGIKPRSASKYVSLGLKKIRCVFTVKREGKYDIGEL
ncbi:MAG TPA: sigma-70 family RNA polymerase sigma factor [Sedimentisphaerales bacterium]|nr:sigma-70 family RNA polymerase sigma factor [Sedimentisphaerales bacterium]